MADKERHRWRREWRIQLGLVAVAGFIFRVIYVAIKSPYIPQSDALFYHIGGTTVADGRGFINPIGYAFTYGRLRVPSAFHPPGYTLFLAAASLLGFESVLDHQLWTCALGGLTIVAVGLLARAVGGPRAGLLAAVLAALYPNLWFSDVYLVSETLTFFAVAVIALLAYACWCRPTLGRMSLLGLACGVATLTHGNNALLLPFVGGSLIVLLPGISYRRRLALFAVAAVAATMAVAPWIIYNSARFHQGLILTTSTGELLLESNCKTTFAGRRLGYYDGVCIARLHSPPEPVLDRMERRRALEFINHHRARFFVVMLARIGRTWGVYRPWQGIQFDHREPYEPRDLPVAATGLVFYYGIAGASVAGAIILRRRGIPTFPLLATIAMVTVMSALTFGQTRYRAPAEVSLVVLAAVAIDSGLSRGRRSRGSKGSAPGDQAPSRDGGRDAAGTH